MWIDIVISTNGNVSERVYLSVLIVVICLCFFLVKNALLIDSYAIIVSTHSKNYGRLVNFHTFTQKPAHFWSLYSVNLALKKVTFVETL